MGKKIFSLTILWAMVILAYIIMAVSMPAITEITAMAAIEMEASANMSQLPGTLEATEAFPYYSWAIPGLVGIVVTVIMLKSGS